MIGPLLAGTLIARMEETIGYTVIFTISFSLFIGAVVCSFFLKRRQAEGRFHFKRVLTEWNHNKTGENPKRPYFTRTTGRNLFICDFHMGVSFNRQ